MISWIRLKWDTLSYNFSWDQFTWYLNGNVAKAARFVPIVGYLVIFNDYVTDQITFQNLTNEVQSTLFLDPDVRLRLIFFGFLFLAAANALYFLMRPYTIKIGESSEEFSEYYLNQVPSHVFLRLHQEIRQEEHWTPDGKYFDDDWNLFWREAQWPFSGQNQLEKHSKLSDLNGYDRVDYEQAKNRHKSVLLSILRETYFRESRKRRPQLVLVIALATFGYAMLLVPSIDLTGRVIQLTILG